MHQNFLISKAYGAPVVVFVLLYKNTILIMRVSFSFFVSLVEEVIKRKRPEI